MRPLTEDEYRYLRAAEPNEFYQWYRNHPDIDRETTYTSANFPEIQHEIHIRYMNGTLIRPTMGESVESYIQRAYPDRQVEQRELTQAEFEWLHREETTARQFLAWMELHPDVDRNSYDRWSDRLEQGQFVIGWEHSPNPRFSHNPIVNTEPISEQTILRTMEALRGNMPQLNSPVRFRNGQLEEESPAELTNRFRHSRLPEETFSQWIQRTNPRGHLEEDVMPRTGTRTRTTPQPIEVTVPRNVYEVMMRGSPIEPEYTVTCTNPSDITNRTDLEILLREYAQKLQRHIKYSCPHGEYKEPNPYLPDNTLEILFWSAPIQLTPKNYYDEQISYFGIETERSGQGDTFRMTDECRSIGTVFKDEQGMEVIQVVGNTLYVLFDLTHSSYHQIELMTAIMELYMSASNPEEVEMRKKVKETKAQARVGEVLTLALVNIPDQELTREKINLMEYERKVLSYQNETMNYMRRLVAAKQKIAQLEASKGNVELKVKRELKSIKKIKGVEKLTTRMNTLRVMTDMIYIENDVAKYEIGKFALEFNVGELKIINQTRKINYDRRSDRPLDHPHVRDGIPCWGNMAPIMEYAQSGEIAMCVSMVMEYLRNYTQGDAWAPLDQWPKVIDTPNGTVVVNSEGQQEMLGLSLYQLSDVELSIALDEALNFATSDDEEDEEEYDEENEDVVEQEIPF